MYGHQSGEFVGKPEKAFFSPVAMNSSQCTELNLMFLMPITSEKKKTFEKKGKLEKRRKYKGNFLKWKIIAKKKALR